MDKKISRLTVLTVEDDPTTRKGFCLFLKTRGYRVLEAGDGRRGLEMCRREQPDLLLLDLRMPEMDGIEVLKQVTREFPNMPVVVVSGTEKVSDAVEALHQGAWDFVLKPVRDMQVLLHAVKKGFERARLLKENRRYHEKLQEDIQCRTRELQETNAALMKEIRERERVEAELRRNEEGYRSIFNTATAALFIVNRDHGILLANAQALYYFGCGRDYFEGLKARYLIHPDDRDKFLDLLEQAKHTSRTQFELKAVRPDGSHFMTETVVTMVGYKGEKRLLIVVRDITERKLAEEKERLHHLQLIQADKMASLGMLVSGVAHEINNPNNFVMVNAPILAKVWKSIDPILKKHYREQGDFFVAPRVKYSEMNENIPGIISGIQEGAKRIGNFVGELKNFARPTAAVMEGGIDIDNVVRSAVTLLNRLIIKSTRLFSVQYNDRLPTVRGNFQQLEQVVINLLENSCQALPDMDRAITVSTSSTAPCQEARKVCIQIRDQGVGIAPEHLSQIKNPFFTTNREKGGTGLGLSISSRLVDDHNGVLEFQSTPGEGTTTTVLLPAEPGIEGPAPRGGEV